MSHHPKIFPSLLLDDIVKKPDIGVKLHPSSLRRTQKYAAFLRTRKPCYRVFYDIVWDADFYESINPALF
ncbi:hypothetical protein DESC_720421 [Desulfosarcina cetonica]|nr:hypothetical protein DESC_720421 [Desulfosarcina cetonica]